MYSRRQVGTSLDRWKYVLIVGTMRSLGGIETKQVLLRGTILNRTYGTQKKQYSLLLFPKIFGPFYSGPT